MSLKKDLIEAEVKIGSNEAQANLTKLAQETASLTNENDRLRISQAKLKALGKQNTDEYKKIISAISENNKKVKENKAQMDALRQTLGLSNMTYKQLQKRATDLRRELLEMTDSADPAQFKKLNNELIATQAQMDKLKGKIGQTQGFMAKLNATFGGLLPALSIAAVLAALKGLLSAVIEVRKEFEKYEAVLKNSLGSASEARKEMRMLTQLAKETPFALSELTAAYVKLVNYGLRPTKEEMRKYGDVASSVGKSLDEYVEAVADAVTGENERLKEFGIKAKKHGDSVIYTFKGVSTEVANNADSIKAYLVGLGELQGVQGSMAAIASTMGGAISNSGDAYDALMNTIGSKTGGVLVGAILLWTRFLDTMNMALKSIRQIKQEVADDAVADGIKNGIQEIEVMTQSLVKNGVARDQAEQRALKLYQDSMQSRIEALKGSYWNAKGAAKEQMKWQLDLLIAERDGVKDHYVKMEEITAQRLQSENLMKQFNAEKEQKKKMEQLQANYNEEKALINKNHLDGKTSEDQYNSDLLMAELKFLRDKLTIYKAGSKEYEEAVNAALQKQVEADKKMKDLLLQAEKELANAKISNLQEGLQKQEASETQRWADEKAALEKRLVDKQVLSDQELALNSTINQLIEEGEAAHQQKMLDLKSVQNIQDLQDMVTASTPVDPNFATPEQQQAQFDARTALIQAQYEKEKALAGDNKAALMAAEQRYNQQMYQIKSEQIDAEYALTEQRIGAAQQYVSMLAGVVDEESALGKALFLFNQALAIGDIWVSIAKANAKAVAALVLPPLWGPVVASNTTMGAIQTGIVLAQTIAKFTKKKGKKTGGFTDQAPTDDQVVDYVHSNEFVANASSVRNPTVKPVLDIIDIAQKQGKAATLNLPAVLGAIGRRSGGYDTPRRDFEPISSQISSVMNRLDNFDKNSSNQDYSELLKAINLLNKNLEGGISAKIYYREWEDYEDKVTAIRDNANL